MLQDRSPTYRADAGFEPANDQRFANLFQSVMIRREAGLVEWINPTLRTGYKWDFSGTRKDAWLMSGIRTTLKRLSTRLNAWSAVR